MQSGSEKAVAVSNVCSLANGAIEQANERA